MVEIAITAVNLGRADKGIIYKVRLSSCLTFINSTVSKFTYEAFASSRRPAPRTRAIVPFHPKVPMIPSTDGIIPQNSGYYPAQSSVYPISPATRPASASKSPRREYKLTEKEKELKALWEAQEAEKNIKNKIENVRVTYIENLRGPIAYMIIGTLSIIIIITLLIKIIYFKKRDIRKTEIDIEHKLQSGDHVVHTFNS